jgi:hypothetical protein
MMSAILVSHIKSLYLPPKNGVIVDDNFEDEDYEPMSLSVTLDNDGKLMTTNQFHDYFYQISSLESMNFFDFARSVKLEKKSNAPKNTTESHPDVLLRHKLCQQHKLADSHQLVQFWNEELGHTGVEYVPSVVGCSIPHPNVGLAYKILY